MISWAGWLIVVYGTAHTLGALTVEGAVQHGRTWLSGGLWQQSLSTMSPAMSAYWLSINSFGPPLILIGLLLVWLNRRGITPPGFIPWALAAWVVVGVVVIGPGVGQDLILLIACVLLAAGIRRAAADDHASATGRRHAARTVPPAKASAPAVEVPGRRQHPSSPTWSRAAPP